MNGLHLSSYFQISITLIFESFSHQHLLMAFHRSLCDNKSPQVSRILLIILADLNNAQVCIVSIRPLISKSSNLCTSPFVTVPKASITIDIIVTFMFYSFFNSLSRSWYLFFILLSFNFTLWLAGTAKSTILRVFFFSC